MTTESIEIQVLKNELSWALKHPADNLSKEFQDGYRCALNQAIKLVAKAQRIVKKNSEAPHD